MAPLRFAVFGAGFWARPQLAAWRQLPGAECAAIFNRTRERAERPARQGPAETTWVDNLETVRLVFAAYESAESGRAVHL